MWILLAIAVVVAVAVASRYRVRVHAAQVLGAVSEQWIAEHRAGERGERSR